MGINFKLALAVSVFVATLCINCTPVEAFPTHPNDWMIPLDDWVDCSNIEDGARIPSTTSCSEYYECDHGRTFYFYCPMKHGEEGHQRLYFDPKLQVCNWPSEVECEIDSNNASVASRSIFPEVQPSIDSEQNDGTEPTDDFNCSQADNGEQFPSPTSCSEFYVCVQTFTSSIAYLQRCPMMASGGRLYYDPVLKTCNWPSKVDCEITSTSSPTTTTMVTEPSVTTTTSETSVQPESTTSVQIDSTTTEPPTSITTTMEPTTSEIQEASTLPDTPTQPQ